MGKADIGHDFAFERSDGNGGFAAIGEIRVPNLPALSRDAVERTHTKSENRWREYIGGLLNAAEFSLTLVYDPADVAMGLLMADLAVPDPQDYRGVLPDGTIWAFKALVTEIGPSIPNDNLLEVEVSFQPSGKPTITVA